MLSLRFNHTIKALPNFCSVEINNKKEFTKITLNKNIKTFIIYINYLKLETRIIIPLNLKNLDHIFKYQKNSKNILAKHSNFANIFSKKLFIKFLEYLSINKYTINTKLDKQFFYSLNYSFRLIKLEIF